MKKHLPRPSARLKLLCSAVFFFLSLLYFWSSLSFPMPTRGLAHAKALRASGVTPGPVAASGKVRWTEPSRVDGEKPTWWRATRQGDGFAVTTLHRTAGLLWDAQYSVPLTFSETQHLPFCYLELRTLFDVENGQASAARTEVSTLAATDDPAVVRVTLTQGWYSGKKDPAGDPRAWLEANGVTTDCVETAPGSGLWLGQQVWPDANGGSLTLIRSYDAAGNLLREEMPY